MILAGLLGGGHDHSHEGFIDTHEVDTDGDDSHIDSHAHWMPFFSLRFWTYLMAGFGATGLLAQSLGAKSDGFLLAASGIAGVSAGLIAAFLYRLARRVESTSAANSSDLVGKIGDLLVGLGPGQPGRVRVVVKGDILDVIAKGDGDTKLPAGISVAIVAMEGDRAVVVPTESVLEVSAG